MQNILQPADFHPFIRCVGKARHLSQELFHMAYDYRMLVFLNGKGTLEAGDAVYDTAKNDVFIISPGVRYRVAAKERRDIIVINFDVTYRNSKISAPVISVTEELFSREKIIEAFDLSLFFGENTGVIKRTLPLGGYELCEKIYGIYMEKRSFGDDIMMSALFAQLICLLMSDTSNARRNPLASEIYGYINKNHNLPLSLENTAEAFHIHPTYLNRLLQKNYNTSFRQLLLKVRFNKALHLIDNTDMTIKEIAERVGFSDSSYFSSAFFKRFGCYPTVYRK
ncbi:MAG: helix-turn-helix transcriptional regulator [Clostridia bacterium]|nr:helix-turn-helix transcriptional regulator [Clostridia bacterium]